MGMYFHFAEAVDFLQCMQLIVLLKRPHAVDSDRGWAFIRGINTVHCYIVNSRSSA